MAMTKATGSRKRELVRICAFAMRLLAIETGVIAVWQFPYASDDPLRREDAVREFYTLIS